MNQLINIHRSIFLSIRIPERDFFMADIKPVVEKAGYYAKSLVVCAKFVPKEKWSWKPSKTARSAFDVFNHATMSLTMMADVLNGKQIDFEEMESSKPAAVADYAAAKKEFEKAWKTFAAASGKLTASGLKKSVAMPWGKRTFEELVSDTHGELMYPFAQMQYLQTIWGDMENHFA